ncbi:glycoside hydrolase family 36 protein [Bifidobacterium sp.]|jgi:alpha-galactosidase|uniref:glycoside hydrolase family 36 protein n=1 Tax=Bifidobacterium sp. TaxID=41200 RepID=UPI0025C3A55F|nr:glycoside hydrolase family 36 protein [Bifidobacterium sp.]MCH4209110.1 alpha-galactosidase [Bifidobacterium sp.]MCI1224709.1 alpha-galactosidase [Bifidobacterium sp.]
MLQHNTEQMSVLPSLQVTGQGLFSRPDWAGKQQDGTREYFIRASRLSLLHGIEHGEVYRNGQNSWSPTGWTGLHEPPIRIRSSSRRLTADDPTWDDPVRHHSSWLIAVSSHGHDAHGHTLLVGCLQGDTPRLHADADLIAGWTETGTQATWVILTGRDKDVFSRYSQLLAKLHTPRAGKIKRVWSSWYSLYEDVSQADIQAIAPQLPRYGFDTLQIDDGWELRVGDWTPNSKFPLHMSDLAAQIRDQGMSAGIWIAPFIVLPEAQAMQTNRQMLLRDGDAELLTAGSNWGSRYFTYDFSRADARQWLADLIGTVVHDWGFDMLKLDFLNAGAIPGKRSEAVDREFIYRDALQVIRQAAGEDAFLLGSGALIFPSLGILDAVRIGPDVAPMWDNYATTDMSDALAKNALRNSVNRLWMKGLIGLDPDIVYFRHQRNLLNDTQMQLLRDCTTLCDVRGISDPPSWLSPSELAAVRSYLLYDPRIRQLGRYRYLLDDREVDFAAALDQQHSLYAL